MIAGGSGGTQPEAIDKLRSLKIPVLVVYAANVDGVYNGHRADRRRRR